MSHRQSVCPAGAATIATYEAHASREGARGLLEGEDTTSASADSQGAWCPTMTLLVVTYRREGRLRCHRMSPNAPCCAARCLR